MTDEFEFSAKETPLTLPQQEVLLWSGRPSWWSYAPVLFLAGILIYVFGAGLLLILAVYLHRRSHRYTVTDQKITAAEGIFKRTCKEIAIADILSIDLEAPSLPIVGGIADLVFRSKDGRMIQFRSIYPAQEIRKLVLEKIAE